MDPSRHLFFEYGNKCSLGLARVIRDQQTSSFIQQLIRPDGSRAISTEAIVDIFRYFYTDLYNCERVKGDEEVGAEDNCQGRIAQYLEASGLPKLGSGFNNNTGRVLESCIRYSRGESPRPVWVYSPVF